MNRSFSRLFVFLGLSSSLCSGGVALAQDALMLPAARIQVPQRTVPGIPSPPNINGVTGQVSGGYGSPVKSSTSASKQDADFHLNVNDFRPDDSVPLANGKDKPILSVEGGRVLGIRNPGPMSVSQLVAAMGGARPPMVPLKDVDGSVIMNSRGEIQKGSSGPNGVGCSGGMLSAGCVGGLPNVPPRISGHVGAPPVGAALPSMAGIPGYVNQAPLVGVPVSVPSPYMVPPAGQVQTAPSVQQGVVQGGSSQYAGAYRTSDVAQAGQGASQAVGSAAASGILTCRVTNSGGNISTFPAKNVNACVVGAVSMMRDVPGLFSVMMVSPSGEVGGVHCSSAGDGSSPSCSRN